LALRDGLLILKDSTVYRLSGTSGSYTITALDNSTAMFAPDTAAVVNNLVYTLSDQGLATISDTGVSIISRPIHNLITPLFSPSFINGASDSAHTPFGVSYEPDNAYLMFVPDAYSDAKPTKAIRYNVFTNTFTTLNISANCGIVLFGDKKLYLGVNDSARVFQERKNLDRTDYCDNDFAVDILDVDTSTMEVFLSSISALTVGDVVYQSQGLTINQFNLLLKKLDADIGPSDDTYYSTLQAYPGDNLLTALAALATKMDADSLSLNNYSTLVAAQSTSQAKYNAIVNNILIDSVFVRTDYATISGAISYEAPISSINTSTTSVVLDVNLPFVADAATIYEKYDKLVQWSRLVTRLLLNK
jgi:hypothetical protein